MVRTRCGVGGVAGVGGMALSIFKLTGFSGVGLLLPVINQTNSIVDLLEPIQCHCIYQIESVGLSNPNDGFRT